jgi:hypothetical protein
MPTVLILMSIRHFKYNRTCNSKRVVKEHELLLNDVEAESPSLPC